MFKCILDTASQIGNNIVKKQQSNKIKISFQQKTTTKLSQKYIVGWRQQAQCLRRMPLSALNFYDPVEYFWFFWKAKHYSPPSAMVCTQQHAATTRHFEPRTVSTQRPKRCVVTVGFAAKSRKAVSGSEDP